MLTAAPCRACGSYTQKAGHALGREPRLPTPDAGFGLAGPAHDRSSPEPIGGGQHDPRPPSVLLTAVAVGRDRLQAGAVGGRDLDGDPLAHPGEPAVADRRREVLRAG